MMSPSQFDPVGGRSGSSPAPAADALSGRPRPARAEPVLWTLPGVCTGMRVATSFGALPVEALRRRDPLRTEAGSLAAVEWVDRLHLDEDFLAANPDAQPVRIPAGAFGSGRPERDLLLSPHQPVNAGASPWARDFRRARDLTGRPGIVRQPVPMLSYHVFHCGAPAEVVVEGLGLRVSP